MVGQQPLVDDVRQLTFEAASGLGGCLCLAELPPVVILSGTRVAGLAHGDDVDGSIELVVARPGQAVPAVVAAGRFDWRGAAVAGVVVPAREAGDVTAVRDDLGGDDRPEAVHLGEGAACCVQGGAEALGARFDCGVEPAEITEQVPGEGLALLVDRGERAD